MRLQEICLREQISQQFLARTKQASKIFVGFSCRPTFSMEVDGKSYDLWFEHHRLFPLIKADLNASRRRQSSYPS